MLPTLCEGGFVERGDNILAVGLPSRGKTPPRLSSVTPAREGVALSVNSVAGCKNSAFIE